jgi:hypothetical protein
MAASPAISFRKRSPAHWRRGGFPTRRPPTAPVITMMNEKRGMPPPDAKEREVLLNCLEAAYPPRAPDNRGWQNPFLNR